MAEVELRLKMVETAPGEAMLTVEGPEDAVKVAFIMLLSELTDEGFDNDEGMDVGP